MLDQFKSLQQLLKTFPDEQSCIDYLFSLRSNCPRCEHKKVWRFKDGKRFKCAGCKKQFTMKTGTMFEHSNLSLRQWFIAFHLNIQSKKGVSSYYAAEEIECTQKTAWHRLSCIRKTLEKAQPDKMQGVVQADETMVGGKNKNRHYNKRIAKNADKSIVFGIYSNSTGEVKTMVVPNRGERALHYHTLTTLKKHSTLITDDHRGYLGLGEHYTHIPLDRSSYQYVKKEGLPDKTDAHNNNIEGFWPFIDRAMYGIYHKFSKKHLQLYCNECTFRFNTRKLSRQHRMEYALSLIYVQSLSYKKLIEKKQSWEEQILSKEEGSDQWKIEGDSQERQPFFYRPKRLSRRDKGPDGAKAD